MRQIHGGIILCALMMTLIIAGCGGNQGDDTQGSTESGQELFEKAALGSAAGCKTCHSLEPGVIVIGPSLAGIGGSAGTRLENMTAEDYIKESIMKPDAYLVEGFPSGVMPSSYGSQLSTEEVDSLVSYLLTLK
jgi:mono/diheme cytochrome c family protein